MSKVLLVEDEDFIRDLYKRQLDLNGFQTEAAANGKQAMDLAGKNTYDLILLDIMLPDTNGLEVLKFIRSSTPNDKTLVVMLTNLGQESIIKEGFLLGAEGYLIKSSLTPSQIIQEIKNIIKDRESKHGTPQ